MSSLHEPLPTTAGRGRVSRPDGGVGTLTRAGKLGGFVVVNGDRQGAKSTQQAARASRAQSLQLFSSIKPNNLASVRSLKHWRQHPTPDADRDLWPPPGQPASAEGDLSGSRMDCARGAQCGADWS